MPQSNSPATVKSPAPPGITNASAPASKTPGISDDVYEQDGDFIRDIEVNDLRNRYTLTKGSTQKMVNRRREGANGVCC